MASRSGPLLASALGLALLTAVLWRAGALEAGGEPAVVATGGEREVAPRPRAERSKEEVVVDEAQRAVSKAPPVEHREPELTEPEQGGALAGLVLLPDGRPAVRARLTARSSWRGGSDTHWTRSDARGRFRFESLWGSECELSAEHESSPFQRARAVRLSARLEHVALPAEDVRVILATAETLAGRALDDAGEPVEVFTLALQPGAGVEDGPLGGVWRRIVSAPDGRFELTGLARGEWSLEASAARHAPVRIARVSVPSGAPLGLRLARMAHLSGRVRTHDGRPAAGARVEAGPITGGLADGWARADEDGSFGDLDLAPGTYRVYARLDGYAPSVDQLVSVTAGEERGGLDLVLRPPARLVVTVTRPGGEPAADAAVSVTLPNGGTAQGRVDALGEWELEDLAPGRYRVEARAWPPELGTQRAVLFTGAAARAVLPRASAEFALAEGEIARVELTPVEQLR